MITLNYFQVEFTHVLLIRSVTVLDTCVFVSLFASNKFEDLNEYKLSKMIENIKLQLIYIIDRSD
jgi:hypothetical protein